MEQRKYVQHST